MLRKDRPLFLGVTGVVLLLNVLPFLLAAWVGGKQFIFDGILLNPIDGHTYLAKMYEGFRGDWRFTLPYTPNPGQGAYINIIYLLLGHVARLTNLSLPLTFSIARIFSGVLLLFALSRFFEATISNTRPRRIAFALSALGSGMGWLLIPAGVFTADFWVAETYPFLSIYDNVHFPLGLTFILWLLTFAPPQTGDISFRQGWGIAVVALALGIISPFGVVIVVIVLAGWFFISALDDIRSMAWRNIFQTPLFIRVLWVVFGGVPMLAYQLWAIRSDPILSMWDAQNLTTTPPWWEVLIALSPAIILALFCWRQLQTDSPSRILMVWVVLGLILITIPFGLQRRFMMGLFIPLAGLAALGLEELSQGKRSRMRALILVLFLLALPTNLVVILAGQSGVQAHDPLLYRTQDESQAIRWLETETPSHALILASPGTGLIIPAFSGRQVIYGHPFETVSAEVERQAVLDFFQMTEEEARQFLIERDVDYIFFGPRERTLGNLPVTNGVEEVFESGEVQIYVVEK